MSFPTLPEKLEATPQRESVAARSWLPEAAPIPTAPAGYAWQGRPITLGEAERHVHECTLCAERLPLGPRPIISLPDRAKIILCSQAPGRLAHTSGVAWNDPSGRRLRSWLGVDEPVFYQSGTFAIYPMGFCYPGTGSGGDLPPTPQCAAHWRPRIEPLIPQDAVRLLIGGHAIGHYLGREAQKNVLRTVRRFTEYGPSYFPLPHPSPRVAPTLNRNPWFAEEVLPALKALVAARVMVPAKAL